jgi:hypothetical protein
MRWGRASMWMESSNRPCDVSTRDRVLRPVVSLVTLSMLPIVADTCCLSQLRLVLPESTRLQRGARKDVSTCSTSTPWGAHAPCSQWRGADAGLRIGASHQGWAACDRAWRCACGGGGAVHCEVDHHQHDPTRRVRPRNPAHPAPRLALHCSLPLPVCPRLDISPGLTRGWTRVGAAW